MPSASGRAPARAPLQLAAGELPPGFFDELGEAAAGSSAIGVEGSASQSGGGKLRGLLSMLPPPSRGRAAAVAAQPESARVASLLATRLPSPAVQDDDESEGEEEAGEAGTHSLGRAGAGASWAAGGPAFELEAEADAEQDDDDEAEGVTAPYPGGDDGYAEGGDDGGYAAGGCAGYTAPFEPRAPSHFDGGSSGRLGAGSGLVRQQLPLELLSKSERRALSDAHGVACASEMASVDQAALRRTFRSAVEVVVPRPAADVTVEGRVFNRQTGAAETTNKPTGGQKRKHQINHLAFQYQQQASELDQRGRTVLKSKAETHGRYGW